VAVFIRLPKWLIRTFHNLTLRQKLSLAFLVMTLAPLFLATSLAERRAEQSLRESVFERNKNLAVDVAHDLDEMFLDKMRVLKIMADSSEVQSMDPVRLTPLLELAAGQYPEVQIAVVADIAGRQVARSDGMPVDGSIYYDDRDYFQQARRTGTTAISDVITSKSAGMLGVVIAEPIRGNAGEIVGLLIFNLGLDNLKWYFNHVALGDHGYAYAVNRQGRVILHPNLSHMEAMTDFSGRAVVTQATSGFTGWLEYSDDDLAILAGYSHIPSVSWGLVVEQPLHFAMKDVATLRSINLMVLLSSALLAILLSLWIAKTMADGIANLSAATVRMADGKLETRLEVETTDELGQLAASFNRMAEQLARRGEALRQAKEDLERQVAERTRELTEANCELQRLSLSDALTCIGNRRYLDEFLEREWRRALREQRQLSVVMLDIDYFKLFNDTYGHVAGDDCLRRVAGILTATIRRTTDFVSRYGGEEFVVVLPATSEQGALTVAEKIRRAVEALAIPHEKSPLAGVVTVSIGVAAIVPMRDSDVGLLLTAADRALYQAKTAGRNAVRSAGAFLN
jgi:diguanylate cyclase (GGDEF)-like protein